jgi:hypothetical protein
LADRWGIMSLSIVRDDVLLDRAGREVMAGA